ncbi:MAG: hypothetical protein ACRDOH_04400 [Streptosporangiaceae bacterium]
MSRDQRPGHQENKHETLTLPLAAALMALGLTLTACSGGPGNPAPVTGSAKAAAALAYSSCMRARYTDLKIGRGNVCSMFARMSRYGPVPGGTVRHQFSRVAEAVFTGLHWADPTDGCSLSSRSAHRSPKFARLLHADGRGSPDRRAPARC